MELGKILVKIVPETNDTESFINNQVVSQKFKSLIKHQSKKDANKDNDLNNIMLMNKVESKRLSIIKEKRFRNFMKYANISKVFNIASKESKLALLNIRKHRTNTNKKRKTNHRNTKRRGSNKNNINYNDREEEQQEEFYEILKLMYKMNRRNSIQDQVPINHNQFSIIADKSIMDYKKQNVVIRKTIEPHKRKRYGESASMKFLRKTVGVDSFVHVSRIKQQTLFEKMKESSFIFSPSAKCKVTWDILCMLLIFYEIMTIPFFISFDVDGGPQLENFDFFVTLIFLMDIIITMNTGYFYRGILIMKRTKILKGYFQFWFWIDVLATFPFSWLEISPFHQGTEGVQQIQGSALNNRTKIIKILRILRFFKILRLLRVLKLRKMLNKIEHYLTIPVSVSSLLGLFKLGLSILCIAHWLACLWHYVGYHGDSYQKTWITALDIQDSEWQYRYISSVYWATTTMITIGYGDILPQTNDEKIIAMGAMLIGCAVFAFVMNRMNELLIQLESTKFNFKNKIASILCYLSKKKVNLELKGRIIKFIEFVLSNNIEFNITQDQILALLSENLQIDLLFEINYKIALKANVIVENFSQQVIKDICCVIKEKNYTIDEVIIDATNHENNDKALYIIKTGSVYGFADKTKTTLKTIDVFLRQEIQKNEFINENLQQGCFGEISFFTGMPRTISMKAREFSRIFIIQRSDFLRILSRHPLDMEKFHMIKDNIILNKNYGDLKILCFSCHRRGHNILKCPVLHYQPDPKEVIENYLIKVQQIKDRIKILGSDFRRSLRPKVHKLWSYENLKIAIQNLHQDKEITKQTTKLNALCDLFTLENLLDNESYEKEMNALFKANAELKSHLDLFHKNEPFNPISCSKKLIKFKEMHIDPDDYCTIKSYEKYFPQNNFENIIYDIRQTKNYYSNTSSISNIDLKSRVEVFPPTKPKIQIPDDDNRVPFEGIDLTQYITQNLNNDLVFKNDNSTTSCKQRLFNKLRENNQTQYTNETQQPLLKNSKPIGTAIFTGSNDTRDLFNVDDEDENRSLPPNSLRERSYYFQNTNAFKNMTEKNTMPIFGMIGKPNNTNNDNNENDEQANQYNDQ